MKQTLNEGMGTGAKNIPQLTDTLVVGGIATSRATRVELAQLMVRDSMSARLGELKRPRIVMSSNGSVIAHFHRDPHFRAMVLQADLVDVDGMPLVIATRFLSRQPLQERVATTDFVLDACAAAVANGLRFFFLGAKPGVAERAAQNLRVLYPGLNIVGVQNGYFGKDDEAAICERIVAAGTDVLWVGMGSPLQEEFAIANRERLSGVAWIRTCGGLFDHHSGAVPRAPLWMQQIGLEWLHRTIKEPMRLGKRYLFSNPVAIYHLITKTHR
jgi:exopolysaccharide biosynthesis WecB/TagA/CpsF family protein